MTKMNLNDYYGEFRPQNPQLREVVGPGIDQLSWTQQHAFDLISLVPILESAMIPLFLIASNAPVVERPEFWVELINNEENSPELKAYLLRMFFLRHLKPGDSPAKLATIQGTRDWFVADETLISGIVGSGLVIDRSEAPGIYVYVPKDPERFFDSIAFTTTQDLTLENLVAILRGEINPDPDLLVIDVSVY
jgi:hypothetical protein